MQPIGSQSGVLDLLGVHSNEHILLYSSLSMYNLDSVYKVTDRPGGKHHIHVKSDILHHFRVKFND